MIGSRVLRNVPTLPSVAAVLTFAACSVLPVSLPAEAVAQCPVTIRGVNPGVKRNISGASPERLLRITYRNNTQMEIERIVFHVHFTGAAGDFTSFRVLAANADQGNDWPDGVFDAPAGFVPEATVSKVIFQDGTVWSDDGSHLCSYRGSTPESSASLPRRLVRPVPMPDDSARLAALLSFISQPHPPSGNVPVRLESPAASPGSEHEADAHKTRRGQSSTITAKTPDGITKHSLHAPAAGEPRTKTAAAAPVQTEQSKTAQVSADESLHPNQAHPDQAHLGQAHGEQSGVAQTKVQTPAQVPSTQVRPAQIQSAQTHPGLSHGKQSGAAQTKIPAPAQVHPNPVPPVQAPSTQVPAEQAVRKQTQVDPIDRNQAGLFDPGTISSGFARRFSSYAAPAGLPSLSFKVDETGASHSAAPAQVRFNTPCPLTPRSLDFGTDGRFYVELDNQAASAVTRVHLMLVSGDQVRDLDTDLAIPATGSTLFSRAVTPAVDLSLAPHISVLSVHFASGQDWKAANTDACTATFLPAAAARQAPAPPSQAALARRAQVDTTARPVARVGPTARPNTSAVQAVVRDTNRIQTPAPRFGGQLPAPGSAQNRDAAQANSQGEGNAPVSEAAQKLVGAEAVRRYAGLIHSRKASLCSISSYPEGATVKLDGQDLGVTPIVFVALKKNAGFGHLVTVSLAGFEPAEYRIFPDGQSFPLSLHLNKIAADTGSR